MLRKHLQRLEQPSEVAKFETDLDSMPEAEVIEHDDNGMHILLARVKFWILFKVIASKVIG